MAALLHTPFPALDLLLKLPWRVPLLRSLLHYDLIGFQTARDCENFIHALRCLLSHHDVERIDDQGTLYRVRSDSRDTTVGMFPISIGWITATGGTPGVSAPG